MSKPFRVISESDEEVLLVLDSRATIYCRVHGFYSRFIWNGTRVVVECCENAHVREALAG